MIPFLVAEALRRARRGRPRRVPATGRQPLWRLAADELGLAATAWAVRPALVVVLSGLAAAVGVHVALGTTYPGPVAPGAVRWATTLAVLVAMVGLARSAPHTWQQVRRSLWRARLVVAATCLAGVLSVVKVGLHDATPGPVLPAPGRWAAVAAMTFLVALATRAARR